MVRVRERGAGRLDLSRQDRATDRPQRATKGIDAGLSAGDASDQRSPPGIIRLRDDARWSDASTLVSAAFADHAMRLASSTAPRAARVPSHGRGLLPNTPGADLLRAAESYG